MAPEGLALLIALAPSSPFTNNSFTTAFCTLKTSSQNSRNPVARLSSLDQAARQDAMHTRLDWPCRSVALPRIAEHAH